MNIREFLNLPLWYITYEEEEIRLIALYEEADFVLDSLIFMYALDCAAMCEGCIFCYPEDFQPIPDCVRFSVARAD
jgi:hypothetical protein